MRNGVIGRAIAAALLTCAFAGQSPTTANESVNGADNAAATDVQNAEFEIYLDRLMRAESSGRDYAANPRSTALGPFQFIKSTFLYVASRHFPEIAKLGEEQILALRTDRAVARRAAAIYSMESFAYLTERGLKPTYGDLRLAYLLGPYAAARVLQAHPKTPAHEVLAAAVIKANPFINGMSTSQLIARSARDVGEHRVSYATENGSESRERSAASGADPRPEPAAEDNASCNRKLASCRRWIAMQANKERVARAAAVKASKAASRRSARPGV